VSSTVFFFFFSSRRRHTRSKRDWSSDVCSSDLLAVGDDVVGLLHRIGPSLLCPLRSLLGFAVGLGGPSLRFFDELLVLGLRLVVALLALGLGFLALGGELDFEFVAGLLR